MLLRLLLETLFQQLQQFLQRFVGEALAPQLLDGAAQVLGGVVQPVHQLLRQLSLKGDTLEELQKHLVKAVELCFVFYHDGSAQMVKAR